AYNPQCNGMVECLHRPLKQALTCHQADWLDALPLVLLGVRTVLREDFNASAAELIYESSTAWTAVRGETDISVS
ncbi:hypothetical protein AVEN_6270-1, partial [Araneus ventricosus]